MEFEKFLEKVKNAVQAYFGENLRLTVSNVLKNNGVTLSGLIFMCEDSEVASTIYLNGFYEEYSQGQPFGEIAVSYTHLDVYKRQVVCSGRRTPHH